MDAEIYFTTTITTTTTCRAAGLSWRPVVLMDTSGRRRRTTTTKAAVSDDTSQESRPHEQGSSWDGKGGLKQGRAEAARHHHVPPSQPALQSKSLLTSTSGATRVHTYRAMQTQLEQIFTHTEGHRLLRFWLLESGLPGHTTRQVTGTGKRAATCTRMRKHVCGGLNRPPAPLRPRCPALHPSQSSPVWPHCTPALAPLR